jgi:tRNA(adenine34) deaminase
MCAGASYWTQLKKVVYGARDEKRGFQTMAVNVLHPKTELVGGIMAEECGEIITDFFASKRLLK